MVKPITHLQSYKTFSIDVLRLDLIHPFYGGNKYFKLKYNVLKAMDPHAERSRSVILTFGGAHSNHIYSTAAFCYENKIKAIGVIRGEESMIDKSPTLQFAREKGMHLHFLSRGRYQKKTNNDLLDELKSEFGDFYMIPEGGNNEAGIKGCTEILDDVPFYDYVFCACGTACTYTGILSSVKANQVIIGISVLKGENELINEVNKNSANDGFEKITPYVSGKINRSTVLNTYHFGGYAKHTPELLGFKNRFESETQIPLDYVYTAKLFCAVYDLIDKNLIESDKKLLIVHSGGQQGNRGYEERYRINT